MTATFLLAVITGFQAWQAIWGHRKMERAYGFGGPGGTRKNREEGLLIRIEFGNYGRTPAFLEEVEWDVRPERTLPTTPTYSNRRANDLVVLTGQRANTEASYMCRFDWSEPQVFYARFTYKDIYGRRHRSGGLWQVRLSGTQGSAVATNLPMGGFPEYVKWD
jgi:hypothetical protein